jgi:hypothetical protein
MHGLVMPTALDDGVAADSSVRLSMTLDFLVYR